ncbi:hypothetical protein RUND412_008072 [Rhizina undulata]
MLHELFLLLSGHPSPILSADGLPASFPLVSPSERALLTSLSTLGHLHISLRHACSQITATHPSTISRAVASGVETHHLQSFRAQILNVERSILKRESGMVGGYDIVSLAKVLSGFEGWERTLRYLHELTEAILPGSGTLEKEKRKGKPMTGAMLINRLRSDIHTGYPTLKATSLHLLKIAETAWLREVSTWVLYGRLPSSSSFGSNSASSDFFITENEGEMVQNPGGEEEMGVLKEYTITKRLLPEFVNPQTASSILFIGRALSIIRLRGGSATADVTPTTVASPEMTLLPIHLSYLQSLQSPLSPQKLLNAISSIRLSLSRHTLQTLLPSTKIIDVVYVLREFFLLGRGEFADAIVDQSSESVRNRWRRPGAGGGVGSTGVKLPGTGALIKEGEVSAILTRTWGVLSSLQGEEVIDERLDTARDLLYLSLHKPPSAASTPLQKLRPSENFKDFLVGVSVTLNFHLSWPLELFLHQADLEIYDAIFAYLISVRKTQIRLHSLWAGRRYPPPPESLSRIANRELAKKRRETLKRREQAERRIWATASICVFFLKTMGAYWQSEVVEGAFRVLMKVLEAGTRGRGARVEHDGFDSDEDEAEGTDIWADQGKSEGRKTENTEPVYHSEEEIRAQQDPESLMRAHHLYLATLRRGLFLSDRVFAPLLKKFLTSCDELVSRIIRLGKRNMFIDLDVDGEDLDRQMKEAAREMRELEACCEEVRTFLGGLVERLQRMDEERDAGDLFGANTGFDAARLGVMGRDMDAGKIDRLLMRLDLGNLKFGDEGRGRSVLV